MRDNKMENVKRAENTLARAMCEESPTTMKRVKDLLQRLG